MSTPALSKRESVALATLQGLLASGHFTLGFGGDDEKTPPTAAVYNFGKDWKKDGLASPHSTYAVEEAFRIADEFIRESAEHEDHAKEA